jgi:hypothetical protein
MPEWEYVTIYYDYEASMTNLGTMIWSAKIKWPGADKLEIRDGVRIEDVLNELGKDGWELVSEMSGGGINGRDFRLKRQRPGT